MTAPVFPPSVWPASWGRPSAVPVDVWPTRLDRERVLLDLRRETGATVSLPQPLRPSAVRLL